MMLKTEMSHVIAERKQEMIIAVMPRAEKFAGFGHEIDHPLLNFGTHVECGFAVGNDVDFVMNWFAGRSDVKDAVVFAGDNGRIHEAIERDRLARKPTPRIIRQLAS